MLRWHVLPDAQAAAEAAASAIRVAIEQAVAERGRFDVAVSGGSNVALLRALADADVPWASGLVHQVDERIAPSGDAARNLLNLRGSLPAPAQINPMPVESDDLVGACASYASGLPEVFDVIQLGLGEDGHTASLVPGDPVLEVRDRPVAISQEYREHRRMTLTFPVLDRARLIVWVATGEAKHGALEQLARRDRTIPGARVQASNQLVVCDLAAAPAGVS
jgi:6-phosphogluconolactonase